MTVTVNAPERKTFQAEEDDSVGNSISFGQRYQGEGFYIEIDNPWAGDTESGFGRSAHISMSQDDLIALANFILKVFS